MKKVDIERIMQIANEGGILASSEKAALAADLLRADPNGVLPVEYAAALLRWQALMLNGEWNLTELNNILAWMRRTIIVNTIANMPPGELRAGADQIEIKAREYAREHAQARGRFAAIEI